MGDALPRVHGPEGGSHGCLYCHRLYECFVLHSTAGEPRRVGWRCCTDCRLSNVRDSRRLRMGGDE